MEQMELIWAVIKAFILVLLAILAWVTCLVYAIATGSVIAWIIVLLGFGVFVIVCASLKE